MTTFRQKVQATTQWGQPDPEDLATARKPKRRSGSSRSRSAGQPPVTAHPLFPVFAALWFAALFGLGSLAISSAALGSLVNAIGLPTVVPAARPPLGFTAHILVAFALTFVGAALGLALALRLRPKAGVEAEPFEAAPAAAPVHAQFVQAEAEEVYKVRARDAHPDAPPRRPLVLTEAFADSEAPADAFSPGEASAVHPQDWPALDLDVMSHALPVSEEDLAEVAAFAPEPEPEVRAEPIAAAVPPMIAATPQLPAGFSAALPEAGDGAWSPVAGASLESLGLVQLIERLALAIAARKAADAAPAAGAEAAAEPTEPTFAPGPFSHPKAAIHAAPAPDGAPEEAPLTGSARDAILRRLGVMANGDGADGDGAAATEGPKFARPVRLAAASPEPFPAPARGGADPASVPFQTDDALRWALATLQRMTARN